MHFIYVDPLTIHTLNRLNNSEKQNYYDIVSSLLPPIDFDNTIDLRLESWFGVYHRGKMRDTDNLLKPFKDILSKHYGFGDHLVCHEHTYKTLVSKGNEFIAFSITNTGTSDFNAKYNNEYVRKRKYEKYHSDPEYRKKMIEDSRKRNKKNTKSS